MSNTSLLVIFTRAPVPGKVKTRLTPPLTPEQAAAVHEASLHDVVARARTTAANLHIRYAEAPGAEEFFGLAFDDLEATPQGDGDLGARLARTFAEAFANEADRVIVIGSDSPTLPPSELGTALGALDRADVVLGPATDGGYYLVGLHARAWPAGQVLFDGIPWSTADVLSETLERSAAAGLDVDLLATWYDIDRIEDLHIAAAHADPESNLARLLASADWQAQGG